MGKKNELLRKDTDFIEKSILKYYPESKFLTIDTIKRIVEGKEVEKFSGRHHLDFSVIVQDVLNIVETLSLVITSYYLVKEKNKNIHIEVKNKIDNNDILESLEKEEKIELINDILSHLSNED